MPEDYRLILNTCPDSDTAERLALLMVENKLAACVNIVSGITSIYRWQADIQKDQEFLLLIKTKERYYSALETLIREHHPYELPEIISVPIEKGLAEYLAWIDQNTSTT
jgi:periplasmic divalent cation tolerance protein